MTKKNKLAFGAIGILLMTGVVYQNCGQMNERSMNEKKSSQSIFLQNMEPGESNAITITLKNGIQMNAQLVAKQEEQIIELKDGTKIKLNKYATKSPEGK